MSGRVQRSQQKQARVRALPWGRMRRAAAQGAVIAVLTFLFTWMLLAITNPTGLFDQSSAGALLSDTFSLAGLFGWPLYLALAVVTAVLGAAIERLGKRKRTALAALAAAVIGAVPLGIGLVRSGTDSGILLLLYYGFLYLPFVAAAAAAAGCVYGFILPGKRPPRWRN
ncbi:MAG TPA: hypothetical protein GX406_03040 [Pseudoclavibacter sp.]|nr:hypothetical protein [Pseudoclavibacter sp.]